MANIDSPNGMRAVKAKYGTAPQRRKYLVKATTTIYENAPVCLNTTGNIVAFTTTLAIAGQVVGVADQYVASGATDRSIYVLDDVEQIFEMQSDDNSITALTDFLGKLFSITKGISSVLTPPKSTIGNVIPARLSSSASSSVATPSMSVPHSTKVVPTRTAPCP